ncbi:MAG: virulence factor SrfB, partial [Roseimicrobium sp.]
PSPADPQTLVEVAQFEVIWKRPAGEAIDVDIVIDFGNTRTVVLALENMEAQGGKLASVCRPIRFIKQGFDYEPFTGAHKGDDTAAIVDSWFVLHEPVFSNLEPPSSRFKPVEEYEVIEEQIGGGLLKSPTAQRTCFVTSRTPQMFVELSPVLMGDSAREDLGNLQLDVGGNYSLSSPKRYAWDTDPVGRDALQWWTMVLNRWNPLSQSRVELPKLAGAMLRFLPGDGRDWDISEPPNEAADPTHRPSACPQTPSFPRSDAMTWAALAIMELAYRQITSSEWRKGNHEFIPRRLRNILVTFPSGWSREETANYRRKWEKALNIFTLGHLRDKRAIHEGGDRPALLMHLDEAVASQLPFVFSEIRRLYNIGENWIELVGRGRGTEARARLMTVDIGGGTTDISIVEYGDALQGGGVNLEAKLLFRDSSSVAGDALAKEIVECVLLPSIGARFRLDPQKMAWFENIFSGAHPTAASRAKWGRIVKLVFMPIVRQWLKDLSRHEYGCPETGGPWAPDQIMGSEGRLVDSSALADLNLIGRDSLLREDLLGDSDPIAYLPTDVEACVERVLTPVILALAKYAVAYEVDLVTLSGKPSELPKVKQLLEHLLPILPQRIIQAKAFPAGDWYPMSSDNTIHDAKSVTAVGAALYQAIHNGRIPGWNIRIATSHESPKCFWGAMPTRNQPNQFSRTYLVPTQAEATHPILIGTCIGRKLLPSATKPEQVYRFRWRDRERFIGAAHNATLQVTLRRLPPTQPGDMEGLSIVNVKGHAGEHVVTKDDVELQLCTMESDEFWIDAGRFEITWPN